MDDTSILISTKKLLGFDESYTQYDMDIKIFINAELSKLNQLAVGPENGFYIKDESTTWDELFEGRTDLEFVKEFIYMSTRLVFDPPQNAYLVTAYKEKIQELEWRINIQAETTDSMSDKKGEDVNE